jgi:hypothetical protein
MENDKQPTQRDDVREEYRSLSTDIAALATPVAVVAAPVVNAWAKQHFGQQPKDATAPQQKTD